jgi:hypothetical protein
MKKENLVFIAENGHYRDWAGKSYFDLLIHILRNNTKYNISLFWSDQPEEYVVSQIEQIKPIFIIDYVTGFTALKYIYDLNIPVYTAFLDMFYPSTIVYDDGLNKNTCRGLIHFANNNAIVKCYSDAFPHKSVLCFNSRFINVNKFKDYKIEKKYDILLYGSRSYSYPYKKENLESIQNYIRLSESCYNTTVSIDQELFFYPLRVKLENIINKLSHKYKVLILPEKCINDASIANEELSMLINQSYLTVACPSIADVMMHKFLEISASNSVILGKYPSDYKDLFEGNIVEVEEFMKDEQIIKIIDDALSDKNKLMEMSQQLYNKVHEEHNLDKALENFNEVVANIIEKL